MTDHGIRGACPAGATHERLSGSAATLAGWRVRQRLAAALACMLAIGLMASGSLISCAVTGTGMDARNPDIETLKARFRTLAYDQLSFRVETSRPLAPPAQRSIDAFIAGGARRLHRDGATEQGIAAAETNLQRFVAALSEAANRSEDGEITPATVAAARNRLCPLYPFC